MEIKEVKVGNHLGRAQYSIVVDDEGDFRTIELPVYEWNRDVVVNALVRTRYRQDAVEAIISNSLEQIAEILSSFRGGFGKNLIAALDHAAENPHQSEYLEFQRFRMQCKNEAARILELYPPLQ